LHLVQNRNLVFHLSAEFPWVIHIVHIKTYVFCGKRGKYFTKANEVFFTFISSQLLDAVIVGILTTVAMLIIKVKYAPLIGFTIGLFNMIPYIGAIVAVAIGILITFITGGLGKALAMAIVVIILQQIDANIINPKIIGVSLEVSPLLVIFSVTVGGAYFGILGMFLSTVMQLAFGFLFSVCFLVYAFCLQL